jgi:hypothetical protein
MRGTGARRIPRINRWRHPLAHAATSTPTESPGPLRILLLIVSIWGLFAMPVTYTGGMSLPHPHSFVQFLREAETGTMSHHAIPDMEETAVEHEAMDHHPAPMSGDEAVEQTPLTSPPSYGIERISLISATQPALAANLFVVLALVWPALARLNGRVIAPLIPPPRGFGLAASLPS